MKVKSLLKISTSTDVELVDYSDDTSYETFYLGLWSDDRNHSIGNIHYYNSSYYVPASVLDAEVLYVGVNSATHRLTINYRK